MSDAAIDHKTIAIETERYHLSAIKFFAVILWFMHLIYDARLLFWLFFAGLALAFATFTAMIVLFSTDRIDTKWFS